MQWNMQLGLSKYWTITARVPSINSRILKFSHSSGSSKASLNKLFNIFWGNKEEIAFFLSLVLLSLFQHLREPKNLAIISFSPLLSLSLSFSVCHFLTHCRLSLCAFLDQYFCTPNNLLLNNLVLFYASFLSISYCFLSFSFSFCLSHSLPLSIYFPFWLQ